MRGERGSSVIVKPMIGGWEVPCIEHIGTVESRRLARVGVPGLAGELQQDLGADSAVVEIRGSLAGDPARDDFLKNVRNQFQKGQPVTFVADIVTATKVDKVVIESLDVAEHNDAASGFAYRVVLREYVEPPAPPAALDEQGAGIEGELINAAALGLTGLDLPGLLAGIPDLGNPKPPLEAALVGVKSALQDVASPLGDLSKALG